MDDAPVVPDLPWDTTTNSDWCDTIAEWEWEPTAPKEWEKSGPCPRCHHEMVLSKRGSWTLSFSSDELEDALITVMQKDEEATVGVRDAEGRTLFFARCNCGEKHPGRPSELTGGCGQRCRIEPPPSS